jgi:hypothetical protein
MTDTEYTVQKLQVFASFVENAKATFELYLKNKNIPLSERWETWKNAPYFMKHRSNGIHAVFVNGSDITECCTEYRGTDINIASLLESHIEVEHDDKWCDDNDLPDDWEPEGIDEVKEKILFDNVGYFKYDW